MENIEIKKGKEVAIKHKHHWVFSKSVHQLPKNLKNGEIYKVLDYRKKVIGHGYFNNKPKAIVGRMINFEREDPIVSLRNNIRSAIELRQKLFNESETNSYRLINGEGDRIPGLVVDRYNDVLVIQVGTLGIEKLKKTIIDMLAIELDIRLVYEKSTMPSRSHEGLKSFTGVVWENEKFYGQKSLDDELSKSEGLKVEVRENGMKFEIDLENSHKTGFYLDQRNMRELIGQLSKGKRVLNCFSYTGGFSVAAALGGARHVTSVDISEEVIAQAERNFDLNKIEKGPHSFVAADVFKYIEDLDQIMDDIVILDPPAFAKKKSDFGAARSGYRRLNRDTLRKMKPGSLLLTCSCSYHMDEKSFFEVIKESAAAAKRDVKILQTHRHAMDHAQNIFHGDMDYLKSYLLWVE